MSVLKDDYLTALDLLAGWEPEWDEEAVKVNGVLCMKRPNLLQLVHDNIEAKASTHEVIRQLVKDGVLQPAKLTSRIIDGQRINLQVHEVVPSRIPAVRKEWK